MKKTINRILDGIEDIWKSMRSGTLRKKLQDYTAAHPYKSIVFAVIVVSLILSGELAGLSLGYGITVNPLKILSLVCFTNQGRSGFVILSFLCLVAGLLLTGYAKQFHGDKDERGFIYSRNATYGNDRFADMDKIKQAEKLNIIKLSDSLEDLDGILIGKFEGRFITIPRDSRINKNVAVCGSQGSNKSVFYSAWCIIQCAKMGESIVATDPKGELWNYFSVWLKEQGYTLRVFNSKDFRYCDGWDMLGSLQSTEEVTMVSNIFLRTAKGDDRWDAYYDGGELNVLNALMLYVLSMGSEGHRTFTDVYEILTTKGIEELKEMFTTLRTAYPRHPANVPWNSVRENINSLPGFVSGLLNKLTFMQNEYLQEVMRHNEIDLELPAKEKCAYFIISSDQHSTYDAINSIFVNLIMQRVIDYADTRPTLTCDVPVHFLLEEMPNLGEIKDIKKKIGVARSRKVGMSLLFQNVPQMMDRYRGTVWEELIGGCDVRIFLGCNEMTTARTFSEYTGISTVEVFSKRKQMHALQLTDLRNEYGQSESEGRRPLMNPTEVLNMDPDRGLLLIHGVGCLPIEKVPYFKERIYKKLTPELYTKHLPVWRQTYKPKSEHYHMFHPISPEGNDYHRAVAKPKAAKEGKTISSDSEADQRKEAAMSLKEMLLKKNNLTSKEKGE